jgi:hypothetical protein
VLKNIPFTGMQMRFGYQRVSEREICSFSRVRVCVCVLQRCSGVALGGVCENTTSGNSDTTTARKSKRSVTRCRHLLLISFNCFLKREKKQSRSFKNDASKRGGKKRDFDDAKILSSSQNVLLDHFFIAHTVLVLSLLSLVLVFFRDLSLSLFDYFTRAASHELRSASRGVYIPAPVDLLRGFHS